jgi:hypothetical protein
MDNLCLIADKALAALLKEGADMACCVVRTAETANSTSTAGIQPV